MKAPLILAYQKIGIPPRHSLLKQQWTSLRTLTRTLDTIASGRFSPIRLQDIQNNTCSAQSVLLVFLGGYRSFYTEVYPLLKERNIPACVCLPVDCLGTYNVWQNPHQEPWQDLLTWQDVEELAQDPLIFFGAHPLRAQDLAACTPQQADFLIKESLFRLEKTLSRTPSVFALHPFTGKQLPPALADFTGWPISARSLPHAFCFTWGNQWRAHWALWWRRLSNKKAA